MDHNEFLPKYFIAPLKHNGEECRIRFDSSCDEEERTVPGTSANNNSERNGITVSNSRSIPSSTHVNSLDVGEIIEATDTELMSTSAVLSYCKTKILYPYLKLLSFMGLRPASLDHLQRSKCILCLWHVHTTNVVLFIIVGYVLQYMACFRRDRGFNYKPEYLTYDSSYYRRNYEDMNNHNAVCYDSTFFSYIGPNIVHFVGFIYSIYLFRISDNEQLQNLMERVFLLSSFPPQGRPFTCARKLVNTLWSYILISLVWTCASLVIVCLMTSKGTIVFHWIEPKSSLVYYTLHVLLIATTLTHDTVQSTIIMSYCLQAQLLTAHLNFLRSRLLTRTISSLDWMREVVEFKKLLRHLNEILAPVICFFTVINISWAVSGLLWLLKFDFKDVLTTPIYGVSLLNELLWVCISLVPFISAARLTAACSLTQTVGHDIIVRPFVHQDTPQDDLNSVLMFASNLHLSARLFRLPVTGRWLCTSLTFSGIAVFTLGMTHHL